MIFEDDETLNMYVEESLDHLADIENDLLAIEDMGENIDDGLVNNVFRAAHSIKGGAGFMGLSVIKELSHNLENVLGLVRTKEIIPTPEVISVLLNAFDTLRDLISNIKESNDANIDSHVKALIAVTEGEVVTTLQAAAPPRQATFTTHDDYEIFKLNHSDITDAQRDGKYIYVIEFDMIRDIQQKGKNPFDVMRTMSNSGIILDTSIDLRVVGTLEPYDLSQIPMFMLFASIIEPDVMESLVELDSRHIHLVEDDRYIESVDGGLSFALPEQTIEPEQIYHEVEHVQASRPEPYNPEPNNPGTPIVTAPEPVSEPNTEEASAMTDSVSDSKTSGKSQVSLRVNVNLLDTLMTLAGELVLSRNQLLQGISANNDRAMENSSQRIDMITSELQEAIMQTRMQPISNIFTKFNRVVRDLAKDLGKTIDLTLLGKEVELDKTIIESINDPLTHLVRNSVDHGIESPDVRAQLGKPPVGEIKLKAYHEAGQVNIEIFDDGKGLDGKALSESAIKKGLITEQQAKAMSEKEKTALIFLPGFSMAKEVTDVSGRGVGMDVVKTNLDKLGGIIDIDSTMGVGTTINIKLPLTLAIIPSQIISVGRERYAIPQVNLDELLRIPAAQIKDRIEKVGDADVVRLRGMLLPLLNLSEVLDIQRYFVNPSDNKEYPDRRQTVADRRSRHNPMFEDSADEDDESNSNKRKESHDRRFRAKSAINIAVVSAGTFKYGLIVDELKDSEEIVVKPLGRHLKDCSGYAGATIMGDGKVALILDVASLAQMAQLSSLEGTKRVSDAAKISQELEDKQKEKAALLLFRNTEVEQCAAPLNLVERIERVQSKDIEHVGDKKVIQYRGGSLPLFEISQVANVSPLPERDQLEVIVFKLSGKEIGLMVTPPVDAVEVSLNVDEVTLKQPGIMGSMIINDQTTLMVEIFQLVQNLHPEWFETQSLTSSQEDVRSEKKILFAEDSAFFRNQVKGFLEEEGFTVLTAEDGRDALGILQEHVDDISLLLTDLEMPNMDGFELTSTVKNDPRFSHIPVIALTSLAGDADISKGKQAGIDSYQIKLDRENMIAEVKNYFYR